MIVQYDRENARNHSAQRMEGDFMSNNYEGRFVRTSAPAQLTEVKKPKKIPFRRRFFRNNSRKR